MNKKHLASVFASFVLLSGLVSCSKEDSKNDSYRASPPIIQNGDGNENLKLWGERHDRTLDLQDSLDVSASQPNKVTIDSTCRDSRKPYTQEFEFSGKRPIHLFQILPEALLTADFAKVKTECAFVITLSNEIGSRHIFNINYTPITDVRSPRISMAPTNDQPLPERIPMEKMPEILLRFENPSTLDSEIRCQDMKTAALPFLKVVDLRHFDLRSPLIYKERDPGILMEKSLQPCRAVILQDGKILQIGQRFLLQLKKPALKVKTATVAGVGKGKEFFTSLYKALPTSWARARISNPVDAQRSLRIQKNGSSTIEIAKVRGDSSGIVAGFAVTSSNWLYPIPVKSWDVQVSESEKYWDIILRHKGEFEIELILKSDRPASCVSEPMFEGLVSANPVLEEVTEREEVIQSFQLQFVREPITFEWTVTGLAQTTGALPGCAW